MKIKSLRGMLDQFASTYREWHYFVGGASAVIIAERAIGAFRGDGGRDAQVHVHIHEETDE